MIEQTPEEIAMALDAECDRTSNDVVQRLRALCGYKASCLEAADEIERLQRYAEECREKFNAEYKATQHLLAQNDRLRAALEQINQDEFSAAYSDPDALTWEDDYWRVVNIARQALGPAHETKARIAAASPRTTGDIGHAVTPAASAVTPDVSSDETK